jgi:ribonuclease P protein component
MLPSAQRLTARRDFSAVYRKRQFVAGDFLVLHHIARSDESVPITRFGFVVSRKVGKSHDRNRIKRRLRAIARSLSSECAGSVDIMIVARPGAALCSFAEIAEDFGALMVRAGLRVPTASA